MRVGATNHRVLGLLPNAPIISFAENLEIQHDSNTGTYYVMFPETAEEFAQYANSIEIIDGQHRVLAFAEDLRDPEFSDGTRYEMIFSVFSPLGVEEKKELIAQAKIYLARSEFTDEEVAALKELRTKWKEVGNAGKDHENDLWNEFNTIVNKYFENMKFYRS